MGIEIHVAYDMTSEEKQTQEFNSLRNIPDSFKKIVIVNGSKKPWRNDEGFVIMGMKYFLLNADSLEYRKVPRRLLRKPSNSRGLLFTRYLFLLYISTAYCLMPNAPLRSRNFLQKSQNKY